MYNEIKNKFRKLLKETSTLSNKIIIIITSVKI